MVDRIIIAGGTTPKFRVSKPGKDVQTSTNPDDFLLREDSLGYYPLYSGSVVFSGSGTQTVTFGAAIGDPSPFCILKLSDNRVPNQGECWASLNQAQTQLTINSARARTVDYKVFGNF